MIRLEIPTIQPEELLSGYVGRVMAINGLEASEFSEVSRRVLKEKIGKASYSEERRILSFAAVVLGMPREPLARFHSNLQFEASVVGLQPRKWEFYAARWRPLARHCKDCSKEDIEFWGLAYWRREHQLPGIESCSKHGTALAETQIRELVLPLMVTAFSDSQTLTIPTKRTARSESVDKYVALVEELSQLHTGVPKVLLSERLATCAETRGVGWTERKRNASVSDFIGETFPVAWLDRHFAWSERKPQGEFFGEVDGTIMKSNGSPAVEHYALVASALCDDVQSALALFSSPSVATPIVRRIRRGRPRKDSAASLSEHETQDTELAAIQNGVIVAEVSI